MKKKLKKENDKILLFEELSWKQIGQLPRDKTIFFLPISPMEEHGPHLPVGTDLLAIQEATNESIKKLGRDRSELTYVLLPSVPLGFCKFNTDFPGSISTKGKIIRNVIVSIGESLGGHGFKYLVICTFHMAIVHLKGIYSAMNKLESKYDMKIVEPISPYFYNKEADKREPKLGFDTSKEVHGDFRETSLMRYLYPYLVDESYKKLQNIYRDIKPLESLGKTFKELGLEDGYIGSPAKADVDYGRWYFNEMVNAITQATLNLYEGKKNLELPKKVKTAMKALFWH